VRVVVKDFRPSQSMRRILRRNTDIDSEMRIAVPTSEQYSVFRAYLDSRHRDGGMADMTVLDYAMMVEDSHIETRIIEYRRREPVYGGAASWRRSPCHRLDRRARRRAVDGPIRASSPTKPRGRLAPSWCSITSLARNAWDWLTSISAIGCAARAKWTIKAASCPRNG